MEPVECLQDQNLRGPGLVVGGGVGGRIENEAQGKRLEVDLKSKDCCLAVG